MSDASWVWVLFPAQVGNPFGTSSGVSCPGRKPLWDYLRMEVLLVCHIRRRVYRIFWCYPVFCQESASLKVGRCRDTPQLS